MGKFITWLKEKQSSNPDFSGNVTLKQEIIAALIAHVNKKVSKLKIVTKLIKKFLKAFITILKNLVNLDTTFFVVIYANLKYFKCVIILSIANPCININIFNAIRNDIINGNISDIKNILTGSSQCFIDEFVALVKLLEFLQTLPCPCPPTPCHPKHCHPKPCPLPPLPVLLLELLQN